MPDESVQIGMVVKFPLDAAMGWYGVHQVGLDELLGRADFISVHCPLTEQTHHLLGDREFGLMKEGVSERTCQLLGTGSHPLGASRGLYSKSPRFL